MSSNTDDRGVGMLPRRPTDTGGTPSRNSRLRALVRVSTDKQDLEVQRQQIRRWAEFQELPVTEWHEEHATSGVSRDRPELDRLLADARRGRYDALVVVALDRLGRSALDVLNNLHELRAAGVRVVSLRESLDFATPAGRLVASVLAHVAEIERESLSARTKAGLERARARGRTLGRPSLSLSPETIERVQALRDEGLSWRQVHAVGIYGTDAKGRRKRPAQSTLRTLMAAR